VASVAASGQRLLAIDCACHVVAFAGEVEGERLAQGAVVFDDQDLSFQFRSSIWPVAR
jgi:hypothetical protein